MLLYLLYQTTAYYVNALDKSERKRRTLNFLCILCNITLVRLPLMPWEMRVHKYLAQPGYTMDLESYSDAFRDSCVKINIFTKLHSHRKRLQVDMLMLTFVEWLLSVSYRDLLSGETLTPESKSRILL